MVYVHVECKCGRDVLQDTYEDMERAFHHLSVLRRECGDEPLCYDCFEEQQEKIHAEDMRQTER